MNTRAIHEGESRNDDLGAVIPPVHCSATYTFDSAEQAADTFAGKEPRFVYGRVHNPTQSLLEHRLANLERAEAAVVTASGVGAIASFLWSHLKPGDAVLAHARMYGNTFNLLTEALTEFGISVRLTDFTDTDRAALEVGPQTRIIYCESPSNPQLELIDLEWLAGLAKRSGALSVVDSTLASPYLQRPLEHGVDVVVHSMTKYLGGHGDLLAGVVCGRLETVQAVRMKGLRYLTGACLAPWSAFLVLRGLKTLGLRMERHSSNASRLAGVLAAHPRVRKVLYPGLPSHPQYDLAVKYLALPGGLVSFELDGGVAAGRAFINALRLARIAVSLGGAETLVQHPASMTHANYFAEHAASAHGLSPSLVRASVGLEDADDIIDDFLQALDSL